MSAVFSAVEPRLAGSSSGTSVLTLGRGREDNLCNLITGLSRQTRQPEELIIAVMQDRHYDNLPETLFPIRQIRVDGEALMLSRARNAAAAAAVGQALLFLDIDCIPSPTFVEDYRYWMERFDGLLMGDVRYLPKGASNPGWTLAELHQVATHHSDRRAAPIANIDPCDDFRCFWSLSFAVSKAFFEVSGGFDERYTGYGGEDTDYGRSCFEQGLKFGWCPGATVYHQFHQQHMPPVHQVQSVVDNNRIYREKWGRDTMEHWLKAFVMLGLIQRTHDDFELLRPVSPCDLDISRQRPHQTYASIEDFFRRFDEAAMPAAE